VTVPPPSRPPHPLARFASPVLLLALMWLVQFADAVLPGTFTVFGIRSWDLSGLGGIVLAPLLHASFAHLTANTVSLALFGTMIAMRSRAELAFVTIGGALVAGIGTWLFGSLFGPLGMHVGASGVVFAYFGYLLAIGIFERRLGSVIVSVLMLLVFGGMLYGVLPGQRGISWEGHLFGFLGGVILARTVGRRRSTVTARTPRRPKPRAR